ncbi:MAG TPA: nicotinate-nucleotide adenylyltransferase [Ramlibacter sp.]|nr:nicotinate-nucleotide adenylyltransferase [Ramlibacter sp.]
MRIGMFGGAFDPPHNAHVAMARAAVEQLKLDQLRVMLTGNAWHKTRQLTDAKDRVAMARLAFESLPKTVVDEREVKRAGATYTVDTLRELRAEFTQALLFLIIGEDQAAAFTTWREWAEIMKMATVCVAQRKAVRPGPVEGLPFTPLQLPSMPVSATDIRAKAAKGEDISLLVPPPVASYIAHHHLYRGNR